ncbi:hypothetical protein IEO21_10317 [Rhodonia placenta]|uniref:Uncharacterized protein n=1 Tax=Rhodonia placenta TaxID=104341 RepID=A0A8H7NSN9_9APHY|nr:hypothetical protein IEO21_10317 [Postia placenta]
MTHFPGVVDLWVLMFILARENYLRPAKPKHAA